MSNKKDKGKHLDASLLPERKTNAEKSEFVYFAWDAELGDYVEVTEAEAQKQKKRCGNRPWNAGRRVEMK